MENLVKKLDLTNHIEKLESLFSREKNVVLEGDINIHYSIIKELDKYNLKTPVKIENLTGALNYLQKQGNLKLYEIYEFVKIIRYFEYLKRFNFEGKLSVWIDKIIIPIELNNIVNAFNEKGDLLEGYNNDLDRVNQNLYLNRDNIKQKLYGVINSKNLQPYLVDHQVHLVHGEQTLMVRAGFNHVLKAKVLDRSQGGFFYVLPHSVSELKQKQSDLINLKDEIVYKISKEFSGVFTKHLMFLKFINKEFDRYDHYQARLEFAKINDKNFILPTNSTKKSQKLVDFKHPAIHDAKSVSIDFSKSVIMITGVNAGGKTMLLKSVLSAAFMSKYLIPYSCDKSTVVGSFKNISAILDDPQSVKNDISTFAGRMVEFSKLFSKTNAIVGVDEIELGTDSDEAASLFKVIIEELIQKDIKIIVTTHHKRLAALLAANEKVDLIAALYDEENRKPTYEFLQGTIGRSYAFETAQRYNIPLSIVKKAKIVYGEDKDKLNELIERSSELEREYKNKIALLDKKIDKTISLEKSLKDQKENLDNDIIKQKDKLEMQYQDAISEVKKAIKLTNSKEQHQILNIAHNKKDAIKVEKQQEPIEFKKGDRVKYNNTKGVLLSIKGKKGLVETDDGMKLQLPLTSLKRSGNIPKIKPKTVNISVQRPKEGHIKLDLHGQRADEAIENLDKFISDSLIAGFDEVLVYHGIGTGKLSYAVKQFLDTHPSINSYRDATAKEGGYGAKVIRL
ncbi:MAG: endonuclease MutS2 [Campylobacterota bacterium]|nr:endonuclease MutS2 [Campylobacterota bacterium]